MALRYISPILLVISFTQLLAQQVMPMPDRLGNVWMASGTRVLKIDLKGDVAASYSNITLGEPHSIDPTDPFRVLVFYRNTQNIVLLSNDASPIGQPVGLAALVSGQSSAVARSARGGIWVLNDAAGEVILLSNQLQPLGHRVNLNPKQFPRSPSSLAEMGAILYLGLSGKGIARFDSFGSPLPTLSHSYDPETGFRVDNDRIWLKQDGKIVFLNLNDPSAPPELFACTCPGLPFSFAGNIYCLSGTTPSLCE